MRVMRKIRVLITDDHTIVRQGLRQLLELEPDINVVGEAGSATEAITLASTLQPDVILMDVSMPGLDGIAAIREVLRQSPQSKVLVLTMSRREQHVLEAVAAGAHGYLLKECDADEVVRGVRRVFAGEAVIEPSMAAHVVQEFARLAQRSNPASRYGLTEREMEFLRGLSEGLSNKQLARRLGLRERTVKNQLTLLYSKLNVGSRTEAVALALKEGLV